ncbi:MAG: hypothetical protein QW587_00035 [Candidatus Bathyarchaeia archaeon]
MAMKVFTLQLALFLVPLLAILVTPTWPGLSSLHVSAQGAFEYYGYTPPSNFSALDADPRAYPYFRLGWEVDPVTGAYKQNYGYVDNGTCYLDIVGINDSTHVSIYDISGVEPVLLEAFTVNRMELHNTTIPAKTYFKVVSDRRVAVAVGGGGSYTTGFSILYPSTDGGFAGKEFIFMAIEGRGYTARESVGHTVTALEDAKVTIRDAAGRVVWEKELKANSSAKSIPLAYRRVYQVVSTGRIMVANWVQYNVKALPSPLGGFVGKLFYTRQDGHRHPGLDVAVLIIVSQGSQSRVEIVDLDTISKLAERTLAPHTVWFVDAKTVDFETKNVAVRSTGDLVVYSGTAWVDQPDLTTLENDATILGVRANVPTTIHTLSRAIAFSPEAQASINIDSLVLDVQKGGYVELPSGTITLTSNATLIVELISQPRTLFVEYGPPVPVTTPALNSWGTYLISADAVKLDYPPPVVSGGFGMTEMLMIGAAAVVVIVILLLWKKPWAKSAP